MLHAFSPLESSAKWMSKHKTEGNYRGRGRDRKREEMRDEKRKQSKENLSHFLLQKSRIPPKEAHTHMHTHHVWREKGSRSGKRKGSLRKEGSGVADTNSILMPMEKPQDPVFCVQTEEEEKLRLGSWGLLFLKCSPHVHGMWFKVQMCQAAWLLFSPTPGFPICKMEML